LTIKDHGDDAFSPSKFLDFIRPLKGLEFTTVRFFVKPGLKQRFHVLCIGEFKENEQPFTYMQQLLSEKGCDRRAPNFRESYHHEALKKTLFWYLDNIMPFPPEVITPPEILAVALNADAPSTPPPKKDPRVIDTPTQLMLGASLIKETINLERDYPYMHSLGIRMKTDWDIRILQRELDKLSDQIESVNLEESISGNDRARTRILVPRCKSRNVFTGSLYRQGKGRPSWLKKLLESLIPKQDKIGVSIDNVTEGEASDNDQEVGATTEDATQWILYAIGRDYENAFTHVAKELGMPVNSERLSAEEFLAMSEDANLGVGGQRMLRRWLLSKDIRILPTDRELRGLGSDFWQPVTTKTTINKIRYTYSYRHLPDIVKQALLDNWSSTLQSFEIHVGGDHGQGAFRSPVKINFFFKNEYSSYETWFFQVDCDKESYALLEGTFAKPLNAGIKMMIEKDMAGGESHDGCVFFSVESDVLVDCCFARSGKEKEG